MSASRYKYIISCNPIYGPDSISDNTGQNDQNDSSDDESEVGH